MLKYSLCTIKNNAAKKKLISINKSGLQKGTSKIDNIIFRGGAHPKFR